MESPTDSIDFTLAWQRTYMALAFSNNLDKVKAPFLWLLSNFIKVMQQRWIRSYRRIHFHFQVPTAFISQLQSN